MLLIDKKVHWLLLMAMVLKCACNDSGIPSGVVISDKDMSLEVSDAANLKYSAEGGTRTFKVESENVEWSISSVPAWLSASPLSGSESASVRLDAQKNTDTESGRMGVFSVKANMTVFHRDRQVTVSQERAAKYAQPLEQSVVFDGGSGSKTIQIDANSGFTAYSDEEWISLSWDAGSITIDVSENKENGSRNGTITISTGDNVAYIEVLQRMANVDVSTNPLAFSCEGGSYKINVDSEIGWKVSNTNTWLNVEPASAITGASADDTFFTLTALTNLSEKSRSGFIYVIAGSAKTVEIPVNQEGLYLKIIDFNNQELQKLTFERGGQYTFNIESNVNWLVDSNTIPEWITLNLTSGGSGSTSVKVVVSENYETTEREATITFKADGLSYSKSFSIKQLGRYFKATSGTFNFSSKPGNCKVSVQTNDEWKVLFRPEVDWIEYADTAGKDFNLIFYVADNPRVNVRGVYVDLCPQHATDTATIYITQDGRYLTVSAKDITFFAKGGKTGNITVNTDGVVKMDVQNGADWLTASYNSNIGTAVISTTKNETDSIRKGQVVFKLTDLVEGELIHTVNVTQVSSGCSFVKEGYSDDVYYDLGKTGDFNLTVTGYSEDLNLDDLLGIDSASSLSKDSYPDDKDINSDTGMSGNIDVTDYPEDNALDGSPE